MKKFLASVLTFCLSAMIMAQAAVTAAQVGYVNTTVRFRSEPKQDSASSSTVYVGNTVSIVSENNGWYEVEFGGKTGYIKTQYVTVNNKSNGSQTQSAQTANPEPSKHSSGIGYVKVAVRFREEAAQDAKSSFTLYPGTQVKVESTTDGWCEVEFGGAKGYIKPDYLEIKAAATQKAEEPATVQEPAAPAKPKSGIGTVDVAVRFREEAAQDAKSSFTLYPGTVVKVLSTNDGWCRVEFNGAKGYIKPDYLSIKAAEVSESFSAPQIESDFRGTGRIKVAVRFRHEAKEDSASGQTLYPGYKCLVLSKQGEWALCEYAGRRGYIKADHIALTREAISPLTEPGVLSGKAIINKSGIYLRLGPGYRQEVVRLLDINEEVDVYESGEGWYRVIADGDGGYVPGKVLGFIGSNVTANARVRTIQKSESTQGYVDGSKVRLRTGPGTKYDIVTTTYKCAPITILGEKSGWCIVNYNGQEGYMSSDYAKRGTAPKDAVVRTEGNGGDMGQKIVAEAKKHMGVRYSWSNESPQNGFDCSGFAWYVFKQCGIDIKRVAQTIYDNGSVRVSYDDLQPGDLVFFGKDTSRITHVGIYIGNGEFIHADSYMGYVHTDGLGDGDNYTKKFVGACRETG